MRHNFPETARLASEGRIKFDVFAGRTTERWHWWTKQFDRRYRLPAWRGTEDIYQELLISAWHAVGRFDPMRGIAPGRYVEWNAVKRTTKMVHRARGCNQHTRKGPNRPEHLECTFEMMPDYTSGWTPQKEYERAELYELAAKLAGRGIEAAAIRALSRAGSAELAGQMLYNNPRTRLKARMCSQADAVAFVRRAVDSVVNKFQKEALS